MILLHSEQASPDIRPNGIGDYISPSRLNLWRKCPLALRLRYVDRIRLPPSPALFLGKQVHDALELFYRHRQSLKLRVAEFPRIRGAVEHGVLVATARILGNSATFGGDAQLQSRQLGVALPVEAVGQRIADTWEETIEADQMRFDSVDAEQALQQQAVGLVSMYLQQLAADNEIPLVVETTLEEPLVDPFSGEDLGIPLP